LFSWTIWKQLTSFKCASVLIKFKLGLHANTFFSFANLTGNDVHPFTSGYTMQPRAMQVQEICCRLLCTALNLLLRLWMIRWLWNSTSQNASNIIRIFSCNHFAYRKLLLLMTVLSSAKFLLFYSSSYRFSEKLDLLWTTAFFVQFLTAFILLCFIGFQAISISNQIFM
jgi:hypothetical protein